MTKIIGHRGAAGLALENTMESIKAALSQDVDAVEFDIHRTKDNKLVVMHDKHTGRVSDEKVFINEKTLDELRNLSLKDGQPIPTLDDVLAIADKPIYIDIKDDGSAGELLQALKRHPKVDVTFVSFNHDELRILHERRPDIPFYVLEHLSPIDIIHNADVLNATGIGLNKWLMNPLTYNLARRYNLKFYVYTLNSKFMSRIFRVLYPTVDICSDHPEYFTARKDRPKA